ncbi:unnamed protein product [Diatraea saccharalis]|uniref:Peptidase C14A caspase catalytic domain-containing protein n=1 Tax=Diatraea saccharalis TaxID=40085 RepID=A0A9P0C6G5_9NEOP|nr:unnamed protein product [Diatraea saccharalis]
MKHRFHGYHRFLYYTAFMKTISNFSSSGDAAAEGSTSQTKKQPKFDPSALYYDMSGDKFLVIFNHYEYQKTRYFKDKRPSTRKGTDVDVKVLKELFGRLGFKIFTYTDKEYDDIIELMTEIANMDHSKTSCLVVVILTHGDKKGVVYAADRGYLLKDVTSLLETGDIGLVNKPKIFFVQACRGDKVDEGRTVRYDGEETLVVPSHVDFLLMQSSVDDYLSWRDLGGSWMIQELCEVIDDHHRSYDLLQLITITTRNVAYKRASYTPSNKSTHNKKQTPETCFTLTKLLKF